MAIEGLPEKMTAVQIVEFHKPYSINQVAVPTTLKEHEILLKTAVASLCHTDSMALEGKFPTKLACTASHEGTGTVVAVGSSVKNFKKGDRVMAGIPRGPCGTCINCKGPNDWIQYCTHTEGYNGLMLDGAFADYHIADARNSSKMPDGLSFTSAAPLACAGSTIYRALIVADVKPGEWVAIVGAGGGLGHLGIQMAKAMGHKVIAIDARDQAIALCKKAGAEHVFDARDGKDKVVEQVQALTDGEGVHSSVNVSEHETAAPLACAITRMHGNMIQVAQPPIVGIPFQELIFRDIRVKGSLIAGSDQCNEMLEMVVKHKIHVETNVFNGLEEVPKMIELSHSGKMGGKAVCVVDAEAVKAEQGKVVA